MDDAEKGIFREVTTKAKNRASKSLYQKGEFLFFLFPPGQAQETGLDRQSGPILQNTMLGRESYSEKGDQCKSIGFSLYWSEFTPTIVSESLCKNSDTCCH